MPRKPPPQYRDLTGEPFGRLRVLRFHSLYRSHYPMWVCFCDPELGGCGTVLPRPVRSSSLLSGVTVSCRCYHRERAKGKAADEAASVREATEKRRQEAIEARQARDARIREMIAAGKKWREVVEEVGVSQPTIAKVLRRKS